MSPNRLSILFFAAALLIAGTSVAALVVRLGAGPGAAQAVEAPAEPASFAGVLVAGSSNGAGTMAPEAIPSAPVMARAAIPAAGVGLRLERLRLRSVGARTRTVDGAHAVVFAENLEARHLALAEGARARRHVVVLACPETRKALRSRTIALLPRKS